MAEVKPSVLLIGASGALGSPVTDQFVRQKKEFSRIGILTQADRAAKFEERREQGVDIIVGSLYDKNAYKGFNTLISLLGNDLMASQTKIFAAALASGSITHIYPSEYNSDLSQPELRSLRYFRDKYTVRDWLQAAQTEAQNAGEDTFKVTLLETGVFTEWATDAFYGVEREKKRARVYGKGENLISVTSIPSIARYIVDSTLLPFSPSSTQNHTRTLRVVAETLPYQALLSKLSEAEGAEYDITFLDPAKAKAKEVEAKQKGDELGEMMWSVKPLAASGYARADQGGLDNRRFGFEPESVRECFARLFGKRKTQED